MQIKRSEQKEPESYSRSLSLGHDSLRDDSRGYSGSRPSTDCGLNVRRPSSRDGSWRWTVQICFFLFVSEHMIAEVFDPIVCFGFVVTTELIRAVCDLHFEYELHFDRVGGALLR